MGENVPFKSAMELENGKARWNLESDVKLLGLLRGTSEEFVQKIKTNLTAFNDLERKTNTCSSRVNNLITSVLILTNSRFIENRVYEEDIKEITTTAIASSAPTGVKQRTTEEQQERLIVEELKTSIDMGVKCLRERFPLPSEQDGRNEESSFDKANVLASLYLTSNIFASHPLPYLLGSEEYAKDTFVGLKKDFEESGEPIIVQNDDRGQRHLISDMDSASIDSLFDEAEFPPQPQQNLPQQASNGDILSEGWNIDEDEDEEDIFEQNSKSFKATPQQPIASSRPSLAHPQQNTKLKSLFDDEEEDDREGEIDYLFTNTATIANQNRKHSDAGLKVQENLVNEIKDLVTPKVVATNKTTLFDSDDDDEDLFSTPSLVSKPNATSTIIKQPIQIVPKVVESKPSPPKVTPSAASKSQTLQSIFNSDSEDESFDIFKRKPPSSSQNMPAPITRQSTASSARQSAFSSSSEEDLFTSKPTPSKRTLPISSVAGALTNLPVEVSSTISTEENAKQLVTENFEESDDAESPSIILPPKKVLPVGLPVMSNVISELNNRLQAKLTLSSSSSSDEEREVVPVSKVIQEEAKTSEEVIHNASDKINFEDDSLLGESDSPLVVENSYNDILRHKVSLNASRRRKAPSRYSTGSNRQSLPPAPEVIEDISEKGKNDVEVTQPNLPITVKPLEIVVPITNPLKNSQPLTSKPPANLQTTQLFEDSDDEDLFAASDLNRNRGALVVSDANKLMTQSSTSSLAPPTKTSTKKVTSLFSSDDSDEDMFASRFSSTNRIKAVAPPSTIVTSKSSTSLKPATVLNTKKSLFDSDSDDDGLFKLS